MLPLVCPSCLAGPGPGLLPPVSGHSPPLSGPFGGHPPCSRPLPVFSHLREGGVPRVTGDSDPLLWISGDYQAVTLRSGLPWLLLEPLGPTWPSTELLLDEQVLSE